MAEGSQGHTTEWVLRSCDSRCDMMKVWKKEGDALDLLFQNAEDMARIFTVGLAYSKLSLRTEGLRVHVCITELGPDRWHQLWEKVDTSGRPLSTADLLQKLHGDAAPSSSSQSAGRASASAGDSIPSSGGGPSERGKGDGDQLSHQQPGSGDPSLLRQQPSLTHVGDTGEKKLQILIIFGSTPGHGIGNEGEGQNALSLSKDEKGKCSIEGTLSYTFSEIKQPPALMQYSQKYVEISFSSAFSLVGHTIKCEEGPPTGQQSAGQQSIEVEEKLFKLGVLHDELLTKYWCSSSSQALSLWASEALGEAKVDIEEKISSSKSRGWTAGGQLSLVGGHVGVVSAQGTGMYSRTSGSLDVQDRTSSTTLPSASGTSFMVRDSSSRNRNSSDILAYIAEHHPYLRTMNHFHDAGLSATPGVLISSSLGRRATVCFSGKFLMFGSLVERHEAEFSRLIGEFLCKQKKAQWMRKLAKKETKVDASLVSGKQVYGLALHVNHGFALDMYEGGRIFWVLKHMAYSPISAVIPRVEER